ncbi:MAG TPA: TROVE domain-containing protein [Bryobacteraceae bacterium]|nr:TROVE domain-containing protein [Bryobacteraceae bacterium]
MSYLNNLMNTQTTPQTAPLPDRPEQVMNSAGGFVWAVDNWTRLERFLILGSEGGSYYIAERALTAENANAVREALKADGARVVQTVVEISAAGRAPKNDPALFVLALASSPKFADAATNAAALAALPLVARTGTHLCNFAAFVENVRGWGRGLRSAVAEWYLAKPVGELAYQMLKYQQRNRWSHRDLLRLAHPKAATPAQNALFQWAVDGETGHLASPEILDGELRQIRAFELAKKAAGENELVHLIEDYRLTQEMIPSEWKNSARVWEALLDSMPYLAMVRNLGKLTAVGLLQPQSAAAALVVARLTDRKRVANSRVHPIALLAALLIYKQGHGEKGGLKWTPVASVIDSLDEAFYLAFDNVEPSGKRIYLALDASGSMQGSACNGMPYLTAAMAAAAQAMVFARTEPNCVIAAFHERIWHVDITRKDRLDRACEAIAREPRGTNASLPMHDALDRKLAVDAFVILTDSETWAGEKHPVQALDQYRRATGIPAKMVVIAMAANGYSIADPDDAFQMDVAGFDASVPALVTQFIQGRSSA